MLTPRQAQIAEMVAEGMSYKRVAREMGLSVVTVRQHMSDAASRIPGDHKPQIRVVLWVRSLRETDP